MQQPQGNFAYCVRCNYPLSAQNYQAQQACYTQPNIQVMYDKNGHQVYVQLMYDARGTAFYVQMIPQVVGKDAYGNPVYGWFQAPTPPVPVQQQPQVQSSPTVPTAPVQKQIQEPVIIKQTERKKNFLDTVSKTSSKENAQFLASQNEAVPPVPVLPQPSELPSEPVNSVPDRPAISATTIASTMYTAKQSSPQGVNAFVPRMPQKNNSDYDMPVSIEELLREEADTAFVQEIPDEETVLNRIFAEKPQNYYVSCTSLKSVSISISPDEITSVLEKNLYQSSKKLSKTQVISEPEQKKIPKIKPEKEKSEKIKPEKAKSESEPVKKLFGNKKSKEQKKTKPIIVDADAIFGDSKTHSTEMLGIRVDGSDVDVQRKLAEMKYGGKKSVRSMKSADQEIDMQAILNDPHTSEIAKRVLERQEVKRAYDSIEEDEVAKALNQLNQVVFPKKF
ncbi:MAG: hypothetical protein K2G88_05270 [Oscillospiraceae bacterium]|nr:hypothetical protein [Oscillospiraceae bacterium]